MDKIEELYDIMPSFMEISDKILQEYPRLEPVMEEIWPKKASPVLLKCQNHINIVALNGKPLFFQHRDRQWVPTLRLLHEYPSMMPKMQVDRGAVKFVLRGSNVMCQGLTSPGGRMQVVPANAVVQIAVEGKQHSCAIGVTTISTEEMYVWYSDCLSVLLHISTQLRAPWTQIFWHYVTGYDEQWFILA
ncbi:PUA domain- cell cycle regulator [Cyclospora cayetanensis]|uniref:PUA domain-cell cycle regulator n=1 Tax=Cyclospora cayetanensis TaxID=88456 RepID=A0A1D3D072_9EIME|nr:PUA domain- cell cycle regulator [Cyclospora cayetanensis]